MKRLFNRLFESAPSRRKTFLRGGLKFQTLENRYALAGVASVEILSAQDPLVVEDDTYSVAEDVTLTVDAANGVLANDRNVDGLPINVEVWGRPSHGGVKLNADGSFTYSPHANFYGLDEFFYLVRVSISTTLQGRVSINVTPVADAGLAVDDHFVTRENWPLSGNVLPNDGTGESLTAVLASGASHGNVVLNSNGTFSYAPTPGYYGPDSFTYQVHDGSALSNVATVNITVNQVFFTADEDTP